MAFAALVWLVFTGCNGEPTPVGPTDSGDDDDVPTGPIRDDEGSVVVMSWLPGAVDPTPQTVVVGMFVQTRRGVLNLAQCVGSAASFCVDELPQNEGDSVLVTALDPDLLGDLATREVGNRVKLGSFTAEYQFDSSADLGFYFGTSADNDMPSGDLGLSVGGEWGDYDGTSDLVAPDPLVVTSPDPAVLGEYRNGEPVELRWRAKNNGDIYLRVSSSVEDRLMRLEDNGAYDLDLTSLGLADNSVVDITLGRWSVADIDLDGHEVNLQVQSNQRLRGTYRDFGVREELVDELYDACAAAEAAPAVLPGQYTGTTEDHGRNLNPNNGMCTGFAATGQEAIVPVELAPQDFLTVNYQLITNDASLYLLSDCSDVASCIDGVDATGNGGMETLTYLNDTASTKRIYIIIDSFNNVTDRFNLDIIIESLGGAILVETCVEAMDQGPVLAGDYHGNIGGHADLLDPACATPAGGGEGMVQVYLDPGQRLEAEVTAPQGDPKLYLVWNCAIADSCFLAVGTAAGTTEQLVYTNSNPYGEFFYLVVDGAQNLGEYFLDIDIR